MDRGGRVGLNPERETKPVEVAGRSQDRTDGRTAEYLVVVETTWRSRRTNVAAKPNGALREAGQP
jgi:alkanesulfonate monooxygenase SsuD/methylene tetrahydromethanopterin reductase-like flavin-dependent oxidoreductase (luciferase family)